MSDPVAKDWPFPIEAQNPEIVSSNLTPAIGDAVNPLREATCFYPVVWAADEVFSGSSPVPDDLEVARSVTKGQGRPEERTRTTSSLLQGYTDWPYLKQALKLERRVVHLRRSKSSRMGSTM
jgi:hypothetical protein